jgi:hypothetical protein
LLTGTNSKLLKASTDSIITTTGAALDANHKNPRKKVHFVANKWFIVIDETIAKHLQIDENDTWFEQILTKDGILLRRYPYSTLNKIGCAA